jgi:hypothetical protein
LLSFYYFEKKKYIKEVLLQAFERHIGIIWERRGNNKVVLSREEVIQMGTKTRTSTFWLGR